MDECSVSVLNTPIKKIRNLTIHSPELTSPIRYPNMNDFPMNHDPICESMVERGYSQTLSNAVLMELDSRVKEISSNVDNPSSTVRPTLSQRKRYSGVHRPLFSKMDSISSHYAATRQTEHTPQEIPSSATKKRRTLNGPEDIFFSSQEDPSPTRRKAHVNPGSSHNESLANPSRQNSRNVSNDLFAGRLQPLQLNVPLKSNSSSPGKKGPQSHFVSSSLLRSSPFKSPSISPSKGSMNLHGLLLDDSNFAKPEGPVRIRQTSLQMAGVKPPETNIPSLLRKASSSELQKPRFHFDTQKKPGLESLNKKPSIGNLRNKSSMSSLHQKPSVDSLKKKPSIPNLQKKPSIPTFQNISKSSSTSSHLYNGTFSSAQKGNKLPSYNNIPCLNHKALEDTRMGSSSIPRLGSFRPTERKSSVSGKNLPPEKLRESMTRTKSNVTIPKPFSLYSKPTISSSQKTFGSQNSLNSAMSDTSLLASQRSLNRFQKFKSKFS